jgi:hypothetical protein
MTPASSGAKAITGGGGTANSRLELGRQVSVYLKTDADLDEYWGGPEHVTSSSCDDVGDGYFPCGLRKAVSKLKLYPWRNAPKLLAQLE